MQTIPCEKGIIGHRIFIEEDIMLKIPGFLKKSIAIAITILILWGIITIFVSNAPSYLTAALIIILGIALAVIDIISRANRNSPIKLGMIGRGEFYGVVAVIVGCFFYLNTRIDSIYQILFSLK